MRIDHLTLLMAITLVFCLPYPGTAGANEPAHEHTPPPAPHVSSPCFANEDSDFICPEDKKHRGTSSAGVRGTQQIPPEPQRPTRPVPSGPVVAASSSQGSVTQTPGITGSGGPVFSRGASTTSHQSDEECNGAGGFDAFKKHIGAREGYKLAVYEDSLGKPTVGYGHLVTAGDNLKVGDSITAEQADAFFKEDGEKAWQASKTQSLEARLSGFGCFVVALASVNYQLGTGWTSKFPSIWGLIKQGKFNEAASALEDTLWKKQTPIRVKDFQAALRAIRPAIALGD